MKHTRCRKYSLQLLLIWNQIQKKTTWCREGKTWRTVTKNRELECPPLPLHSSSSQVPPATTILATDKQNKCQRDRACACIKILFWSQNKYVEMTSKWQWTLLDLPKTTNTLQPVYIYGRVTMTTRLAWSGLRSFSHALYLGQVLALILLVYRVKRVCSDWPDVNTLALLLQTSWKLLKEVSRECVWNQLLL